MPQDNFDVIVKFDKSQMNTIFDAIESVKKSIYLVALRRGQALAFSLLLNIILIMLFFAVFYR